MARLEDFCSVASSSIKQSDLESNDGKYPIYGASGLIKYVDFYIQDKPYIGIVKDGAGVGRVMCLPPYSSVIGTMQYIIPKENVNVEYLAYAMEYMNLSKYYSGATIPHIYFRDYKNEPIPNYAIKDQERIAHIIKKVNELSSLRKEQLQKLDDLVKARFVEMFGQEHRRMSMQDICCIITDGTHQPPKFVPDGIPFIFVSNITSNKVTYDAEKYIDQTTYDELIKRTPIEIGDILLSTVGSYGHPAVVKSDKKFLFQRHIAYLKPDHNVIDSDYLHGAILSPDAQKQIEEGVKGIAQKTLNLSEIKKLTIPVPTMAEQKAFAAFISRVDKSKMFFQQGLEKLETLKKSLMQQYFG